MYEVQKAADKFKYIKTRIYREHETTILSCHVKFGKVIRKNDIFYKKYNPENVKTIEIVLSETDGKVTSLVKNEKFLKIVIEEIRNIEVGDKMTSLHGQKVVISRIVDNEDMPTIIEDDVKYTLELLINPHAFPSRMTMGQIKEMSNQKE